MNERRCLCLSKNQEGQGEKKKRELDVIRDCERFFFSTCLTSDLLPPSERARAELWSPGQADNGI